MKNANKMALHLTVQTSDVRRDIMEDKEINWNLEEEVAGLCADLLSYKDLEPFVTRLVEQQANSWGTLKDLCTELNLPLGQLKLLNVIGDIIQVTHLPWPGAAGEDDQLILFFNPKELWSYSAYYNTRVLRTANKDGDRESVP